MGGRVFYETHFWPQLKLHGSIEEVYFSLRSPQGEAIPVLANAIRQERDGDVFYDCVLLRISQRNQYENELVWAKKAAEQANEAKAEFLSMMSHELRTPLNAIMGFAQLMASDVDNPLTPEQQEDLSHIQAGSNSLRRLIDDILNFAHMESKGVEVAIESVDVENAIVQAELLVRPQLQAKGIRYRTEGGGTKVSVIADSGRLQQILLNLLTNAIKFTPSDGSITVTYSVFEDQVCIQVCDSGIGIADEQLERIFEPFVQVNRQQVESGKRGVGLGLAICRKLAHSMNGDLTVTSVAGEGSTFILLLPRNASS